MEVNHFEWLLKHLKEQRQQRLSAVVCHTADSCHWGDDKWRRHLRACIHAKGRHFEHFVV